MELNPIGPNQTELRFDNGTVILFSYKTPVAANVDGVFYRTTTKHSVTTSRHINQWLGRAKARPQPQEWFTLLTCQTCQR